MSPSCDKWPVLFTFESLCECSQDSSVDPLFSVQSSHIITNKPYSSNNQLPKTSFPRINSEQTWTNTSQNTHQCRSGQRHPPNSSLKMIRWPNVSDVTVVSKQPKGPYTNLLGSNPTPWPFTREWTIWMLQRATIKLFYLQKCSFHNLRGLLIFVHNASNYETAVLCCLLVISGDPL